MAIQALVNPHLVPAMFDLNTQTTAVATAVGAAFTFDGAADKFSLVTHIPKSGLVTGIRFRTGTVSTTGATFQMQIEGVDGSGNPDGTPKYTNANGTVVVAASDDNVWKTVSINFGTGVSVVKGDLVAIVLSVSSGTPNTVVVAGAQAAAAFIMGNFPCMVEDTGAGYAKSLSGLTWCMVFDYNGTLEQVLGATPAEAGVLTTIGNDAERGLRFSLLVPMRVAGIRARLCNIAAGANFRARIYQGTTTILADSLAIDGDVANAATRDNYVDIIFPESPTLVVGTTYYASIWQLTANNLAIYETAVSATAYMNAMPGGANFYRCNRAAGGTGAWTETDTSRPSIALLVDGFEDGTGGGSAGELSKVNGFTLGTLTAINGP